MVLLDRLAAFGAALILVGATSASAATITSTVIDFDGLNGNLTNEVIGDYVFTTLNVQNSTQCATGRCIQEVGQGTITTMSRVDNGVFDLESFYFSLQGNGKNSTNSVSLISDSGETYTYALGDDDSDGAVGGDVFLYDAATNSAGADVTGTDVLEKSNGKNGPNYVVVFGSQFDGVTFISWFSADTANERIDNITVSSMAPVPLPAAGWMLIAGLGGMAAMARRRKT